MDFTSSNEQTALADTLRRFLTNAYSADQRIKYAELPDGYSAACWRMLADLGLVALHLEEENGGLGGSMIDMMVALQALGPGLVLEPWLATLTADVRDASNAVERHDRISAPFTRRELTLELSVVAVEVVVSPPVALGEPDDVATPQRLPVHGAL